MKTKPLCGCGRPVHKADQVKCGQCRRKDQQKPCVRGCGAIATNGNDVCGDCRDREEVEATKVLGWMRGPRGSLVGSFDPHSGYPCTAHHFCDQREAVA